MINYISFSVAMSTSHIIKVGSIALEKCIYFNKIALPFQKVEVCIAESEVFLSYYSPKKEQVKLKTKTM